MTNRWIASVAMIVPVELREQAAIVSSQMSSNINDSSPLFFSRAVVNIETNQITHYLAHSRIREAVLQQLPQIKSSFPGAEYYVTQHDEIIESRPTIDQWLESMGLKLFVEEEE